ncbi:MAG: hypothetical protein CMJ78_11380 [Planctomycetaceae bacterium]|nr:hypothetical protein [Planctomycetaceae bacterium]
MLYWMGIIVGAMDVELFDFDFEMDADSDSILDLGFVPLRFLNLGSVPLMVWGSVFSISFWGVSMGFDGQQPPVETGPVAMALFRNGGIALILTKILTQPLCGRFVHREPNTIEDLIGQNCVVTTTEVNDRVGQAEYQTEGAPLLLNVRANAGELVKGDLARIVGFDEEKHVYVVTSERNTA